MVDHVLQKKTKQSWTNLAASMQEGNGAIPILRERKEWGDAVDVALTVLGKSARLPRTLRFAPRA